MGPIGHQRIAQRFTVATTPVRWKIPRRRGLNARSKAVQAEAAVVELSVMGAAIVCPLKWRAVVGSKVEVEWEGHRSTVVVRREAPYPGSTTVALYGVEWTDSNATLAKALFERLVMEPAKAPQHAPASSLPDMPGLVPDQRQAGPVRWTTPNSWSPDAR